MSKIILTISALAVLAAAGCGRSERIPPALEIQPSVERAAALWPDVAADATRDQAFEYY